MQSGPGASTVLYTSFRIHLLGLLAVISSQHLGLQYACVHVLMRRWPGGDHAYVRPAWPWGYVAIAPDRPADVQSLLDDDADDVPRVQETRRPVPFCRTLAW